jgi:hypothetical protein
MILIGPETRGVDMNRSDSVAEILGSENIIPVAINAR